MYVCDGLHTTFSPAYVVADNSQYPFLMHSMLGLGAALVASWKQPSVMPAVQFHMIRAVKGVNEMFARLNRSADEDDALISACYAVAFSHARAGEGVSGYWITIRTASAVNSELKPKAGRSRFGKAIGPHVEALWVTGQLRGCPLFHRDFLEEGMRSLQPCAMLCDSELEIKLYGMLLNTFEALLRSPAEVMIQARDDLSFSNDFPGYFQFTRIYELITVMDSKNFSRLTDPNECVVQLLQFYIFTFQTITEMIVAHRTPPDSSYYDRSVGRWTESLCVFPHHLDQYLI